MSASSPLHNGAWQGSNISVCRIGGALPKPGRLRSGRCLVAVCNKLGCPSPFPCSSPSLPCFVPSIIF